MKRHRSLAALLLAVLGAPVLAQTGASTEGVRLHGATVSGPMREAIEAYKSRVAKIVGGREAADGAFPWQVSLGVAGINDAYWAHFCGGSIYAPTWIITAAHCVDTAVAADVTVAAGTNVLNHATPRIRAQRILLKRGFDSRSLDQDIALVELAEPLALGARVQAIALIAPQSESDVLAVDAPLVAAGWGATQAGGGFERRLLFVEVPFVARDACNRPLAHDNEITENMICAGVAAGGKDACQGDSGGPLTARTASSPVLVGVVSKGKGCGRPNKFGIYTRVARYLEWAKACTANPDQCD